MSTESDASIPEVDVATIPEGDSKARAEQSSLFDGDARKLDLNLRRWAAYGALVVVACLYGAGLCVALRFSRPVANGVLQVTWHVVAATLAALFTVPTVLVLAVLRSASAVKKDETVDSLHAAIGTKLLSFLEKFVDRLAK